jgi:hypothetical protein
MACFIEKCIVVKEVELQINLNAKQRQHFSNPKNIYLRDFSPGFSTENKR